MEIKTSTPKSHKLLEALIAATVFLICLIGAEVFLRRVAPISDPYEIFKATLPNPYIRSLFRPGYKLRTEVEPGLPGVNGRNLFSANNVGFRGDNLATPKPANEWRVFIVGGSTTECLYLDDSQAINRVLQTELQQRLTPDTVVKVYNAGKSGDRTDDHISMIVHRIIHMQPDLIIVFAGINDLSSAIAKADYMHLLDSKQQRFTFLELIRMATTEFQIPRRIYYIGKKLFLKQDVRDVLEEIKAKTNYAERVKFIAKFPISDRRPQLDQTGFRNNLTTIAGVAKSHGVPLVFMTQQTTWNSSIDPKVKDWQWMLYRAGTRYRPEVLDAALESFNEVTKQVGTQQGIPVFDAVRAIPKSLDFFYDDVHFNVNGARQAATGLATFLADNRLMKADHSPMRAQVFNGKGR